MPSKFPCRYERRRSLIKNPLFTLLVAGLELCIANSSIAQTRAPDSNGATLLTFTEHAERSVPRDTLHAELRIQASGSNAAKLQGDINQRTTDAIRFLKETAGVQVETTGYGVYKGESEQKPIWRGSQSLRVTSKDFTTALDAVAGLQQRGAILSDLSTDLSSEAILAVQSELTREALGRIQNRANEIANVLGTKIERYEGLHVGNATIEGGLRPMAAAATSSDRPPPTVEATDTVVSVSIDATVLLAPAPSGSR
jgi:predicted secreted protein